MKKITWDPLWPLITADGTSRFLGDELFKEAFVLYRVTR